MTAALTLPLPLAREPAKEAQGTAYTLPAVTRLCVRYLAAELAGRVVWEPHVGAGGWARMALGEGGASTVIGCDVDPGAPAVHPDAAATMPDGGHYEGHIRDVMDGPPPAWAEQVEVVLGNPPWELAHQHLGAVLDSGVHLVAWILQADRLGRQRHWPELLRRAWPDEVVQLGRLSYGGPGRDGTGSGMTDSALYIWRRTGEAWSGRGLLRRWDRDLGQVVGAPLYVVWVRYTKGHRARGLGWEPYGNGRPVLQAQADVEVIGLQRRGDCKAMKLPPGVRPAEPGEEA